MHRQISVDGLSLEELYDVEPIERTGWSDPSTTTAAISLMQS